jgi:NADPH2:quinone reductase
MIIDTPGGPEVLHPADIELAWPGNGTDVLVRLKAAGINPADTFFRALGTYVETPGPTVLGHDGAGIVEAIGPDVRAFRPGDRVCFCNGGIGGAPGTYAHHAVVPQAQLVTVPDSVDFVQAAAFPLVAITAWEALVERSRVEVDEQVLIHGGAGGTGQMAIQVAALRGARVAATVSSKAKADIVETLGAERPILYREHDFVDACKEWTDGRGLHVALDNVGEDAMARTYGAMAPYGRVVTLLGTAPDDADLNAYNRNLSIHNVMMLTPMWFGLDAELARQASIVRDLIARLEGGTLRVAVEETYSLDEAPAAHARLEAGGMAGKLVLVMED